jgi:hypothetical protein
MQTSEVGLLQEQTDPPWQGLLTPDQLLQGVRLERKLADIANSSSRRTRPPAADPTIPVAA